jgi:hypothetical protein
LRRPLEIDALQQANQIGHPGLVAVGIAGLAGVRLDDQYLHALPRTTDGPVDVDDALVVAFVDLLGRLHDENSTTEPRADAGALCKRDVRVGQHVAVSPG